MSRYIPTVPVLPEKLEVKAELKRQSSKVLEIPCIVGGKRIRTGDMGEVVMPHDHKHVIARFHKASAETSRKAISAAMNARAAWSSMAWQDRAAIFLRAADLLVGPYRQKFNASTMLGQSKNIFQSEVDAVCELADFWRFNAWYAEQIYSEQPPISPPGVWNRLEQRPLDGFVFAISPFNFTSIAANLTTAPALMGNVTVWKPSETQTHSAWYIMELLKEAGLPDGVVNMLPGDGPTIGGAVMTHPDLAGVHFTGSTATFQHLQKVIGENIHTYRNYPACRR